MDFIEFMILKAVVVVVAAFLYGIWLGVNRR